MLKPDEIKVYQACLQYERNYNATYHRSFNLKIRKRNAEKNRAIKDALESLAASRELSDQRKRLMEEHQYQYFYSREDESEGNYCIGCGMIKGLDCKPDCLWAQAIKGE